MPITTIIKQYKDLHILVLDIYDEELNHFM